jgi:hypothetical protein
MVPRMTESPAVYDSAQATPTALGEETADGERLTP